MRPTAIADIETRRSVSGVAKIAMFSAYALLAFLYGFIFTLLPPWILPILLIPIGILALVVIWALPTSERAPTKLVYSLFLGFYVALIVWPNYLALSLPGLPWITLIRIIGIPLAVIMLICVSLSANFRKRITSVLESTPVIWKLLLAFIGVQLITIAFSRNPFQSLEKVVIAQIYWTSIFFAACYVFRERERIRLWALILCSLAIYVSAVGLWEWRIGRVPWAGHIPSFLQIQDESVIRILAGARRAATGIYRVQSTFTTSLGLSEFLALAMPFLIHFVVARDKLLIKVLSILAIPLVFLTIVNSDARLGAVGFFSSFLLYGSLWSIRRWKLTKQSIFGPAFTLALPLIFSAFLIATLFVGRLHNLIWGGGQHQFSTEARLTQIDNGIPLILSWPIGFGAGQGADVLGFTNGEGTLTIDSYYLSMGLEYGIIGFIIYFGIFIAAIIYGLRTLSDSANDDAGYLIPVVCALVIFLIIKSIFSQDSNHPIVYMLLGITCTIVHRQKESMRAI